MARARVENGGWASCKVSPKLTTPPRGVLGVTAPSPNGKAAAHRIQSEFRRRIIVRDIGGGFTAIHRRYQAKRTDENDFIACLRMFFLWAPKQCYLRRDRSTAAAGLDEKRGAYEDRGASVIKTVRKDRRTGAAFCSEVLQPLLERDRFDLVIVDPALEYLGGDANRQVWSWSTTPTSRPCNQKGRSG